MLTSLLVLLFLLDLLHTKILTLPLNRRSLCLGWNILLDIELFSQLLILNELIISKVKHNSKVVSSLLINNSDILDGFHQGLVVSADVLLHETGVGKDLLPITNDLSGLEVLFGLFGLLLVQVLVQVGKLGLLEGLSAAHDLGDVVQDGGVELQVFLLHLPDGLSHLVLDFSDLFVSFVNGDGFDLFRKGEFLDALFDVFRSDFTLTLR